MTIQLPQDPKAETYEDLIAACLTGLGFFIEANLHLRDQSTEVLELDVVATPVTNPLNETLLLDAKSGKSGIADMFKMFGWRSFLHIPKACVVRSQPPDRHRVKAMKKLAKETAVHVATVNLDDFDLDCFPSVSIDMPQKILDAIIPAAWYGRMAKRLCLREFITLTKRNDITSASVAKEYRWAIEQSFFVRLPIDRAKAVYDAYMNTPGITGRIVDEIAEAEDASADGIWDQIRDSKNHPALQFSLMMEHTARLRIVKNAMIHLLQRQADQSLRRKKAPKKHTKKKTKLPAFKRLTKEDLKWLVHEWGMPDSFRNGLKKLRTHRHRERIPFLWQLFIEVFGGFYCLRDDCDLQVLSDATEIPVDDVVECLELYETFFPVTNGWFFETKGELRIMKMVPAVYHGTGVFVRDFLFGKEEYDKHIPSMTFLRAKWNNALYGILESELKSSD